MTPEIASTLCDKTATIRAMFAEVENDHEERLQARLTPAKPAVNSKTRPAKKARTMAQSAMKIGTKVHAKGTVPDWNKIHAKQLFQRQPDIAQWQRERQARTDRLFSGNATAVANPKKESVKGKERANQKVIADKMSTPAFRSRSKSLVHKKARTHNSEKTAKKHSKKVTMAPSTNDLKYADSKINAKVAREATPYKHSEAVKGGRLSLRSKSKKKASQRASAKPKFGMAPLTEEAETPILEEGIEEGEEETETESVQVETVTATDEKKEKGEKKGEKEKKAKVPRLKLKLAFNPDKIKSRLFESTSCSAGKGNVKRGSATPQVMSRSKSKSGTKKKTVGRGSATPQVKSMTAKRRANYSTVKSKLDTGRRANVTSKKTGDEKKPATARRSGLKRRLSWKGGDNAGELDSSEPVHKKRKMSTKKGWQ